MNALFPERECASRNDGLAERRHSGRQPNRRSPYPSSPEIKRLIKAARDAGLDVAGIEASPDGTVRLVEARALPAAPASLFDELVAKGKI